MLTRMFEVERNIDSVVCKERRAMDLTPSLPSEYKRRPFLVHPNFQHGTLRNED